MRELLLEWASDGRTAAVVLGAACIVAFLVFAAILSAIDAREHRLPRRWVSPMYPVLVPLGAAAFLCAGRQWALLGGVLGACLLGLFFGTVRVASPPAMGLGDLRLAPVLGWLLGLVSVAHALAGLLLTFLLAGLWAGALVLTGRARASTHIAFGPWMLAGTALGWLLLPVRLL